MARRRILILSTLAISALLWTTYRPPHTEEKVQEEILLASSPMGNDQDSPRPIASMPFQPGLVKPVGQSYTKTLIVSRTRSDEINWIHEHFGESKDLKSYIYSVDDVSAALHVPKNKGHESMTYLSYIIENYEILADVNIFMHSHRYAWHNNELLNNDAVEMINRFSAERVQRLGYVNLRCDWEPGCPSWIRPFSTEENINRQEETIFARSWVEMFPLDPIPKVLAQPCCAQFAVSRDRIRTLPLQKYVRLRDWILRTPLADGVTGRVLEYTWHFLFTGTNVVCWQEHICYCDSFGICFGGEQEYNIYREKIRDKKGYQEELEKWEKDDEGLKDRNKILDEEEGGGIEGTSSERVEAVMELRYKIAELQIWCDQRKQLAKQHGGVAMNRAKEAGRHWEDGDGF